MSLELYDTALSEISNIKTELYSLFFGLIDNYESPEKQPPIATRSSRTRRSNTFPSTMRELNTVDEVKGSKKQVIVIDEEENIDPPKQSDADIIVVISDLTKNSEVAQTNSEETPQRISEKVINESSYNTPAVQSKKNIARRLLSSTPAKTQKTIRKVDMRITRSRSIKKGGRTGNKMLLRSRKKVGEAN